MTETKNIKATALQVEKLMCGLVIEIFQEHREHFTSQDVHLKVVEMASQIEDIAFKKTES